MDGLIDRSVWICIENGSIDFMGQSVVGCVEGGGS